MGFPVEKANPFAKFIPEIRPPINPGPFVTQIISISSSLTLLSLRTL